MQCDGVKDVNDIGWQAKHLPRRPRRASRSVVVVVCQPCLFAPILQPFFRMTLKPNLRHFTLFVESSAFRPVCPSLAKYSTQSFLAG